MEMKMNRGNTPAFKEWASVVEALGTGRQIFVLRKGGIHEKRGQFQIEHERFWLFPTKFHEQGEKIKPLVTPPKWIFDEGASTIPLQYWTDLVEVMEIRDEAKLHQLFPYHIWSEATIQEKFTWGAEQAVYLLLLRVYKIAEPIALENDKRFGGCKSWIEVPAEILAENAVPAVSNDLFTSEAERIRKIFQEK